jgi:hypothetical protein
MAFLISSIGCFAALIASGQILSSSIVCTTCNRLLQHAIFNDNFSQQLLLVSIPFFLFFLIVYLITKLYRDE